MKKLFSLFTIATISLSAFAQHDQKETRTGMNQEAMLDGKIFAVVLTENITGTTGTPGTVSQDAVNENQEVTTPTMEGQQPNPATKMNSETQNKRKMLIRFDNGMIKLSGKGEFKNEKCPYKSWGMESTGISYSSDCSQSTSDSKQEKQKSTVITGTVNGDTIHGSMTCTKSDGTVRTYSYTGSKAGQNDLDMENEMGMK